MKCILVCLVLLSSVSSIADQATYDDFWQWNKNVTISKVQVIWDASDTRIILSNGETCRIVKKDKELYSLALAMKAQNTSGEVLCQKEPISGNERRVHRLTF